MKASPLFNNKICDNISHIFLNHSFKFESKWTWNNGDSRENCIRGCDIIISWCNNPPLRRIGIFIRARPVGIGAPDFERSVNPISARGTDYTLHITTGTPGFSELPTALFISLQIAPNQGKADGCHCYVTTCYERLS